MEPIEIPVDRPWHEPLRRRMAELDLGYEPVFADVDLGGTSLVVALESLGAVSPPDIPVCWSFQAGAWILTSG